MADTEVVLGGLVFPEGPRWHDGRLWFSDMHDHRVLALDDGGTVEEIVRVPMQPSGLGWQPDGRLLVVSMLDRSLMRLEADGTLALVADLSALASFHCNDMVVDSIGRAYIGNFGFDLDGRGPARTTSLVMVSEDGHACTVADELMFPNGMVITPDGTTFVVGESFGARLTAFDVAADGSLGNRRLWAQLDGAVPDGICLDEEGAIWVASPVSHEVVRVLEGGSIADRVAIPERKAYACMLGGDDRRTLYVCSATTSNPSKVAEVRGGCIERVRVSVAGAGYP